MTTAAEAKTGELVKTDPAVAKIEAMIGQNKNQMAALLGKNISVERLFQIALTTISRVPKLKDCTTASVLGCVMESSRLRLPAGVGAGGTWLIPRENKKTGQTECTLIVDYRAIILMMKRDAGVETVVAEAIHDKDTFDYGIKADGPYLDWHPAKGNRGAVHGYVAASWNKAGKLTGVIYKTVQEIKETSLKKSMAGTRGEGPWASDPEWMFKKSVIRPLGKLNPGIENDDLSRAIALDERAELDLPQNLHLLADATGKPQLENDGAKTPPPPPMAKKGEEWTPAQKIGWARDAAGKQGVSAETFNAWLGQQAGDEAAKAAAAEKAWKAVAAKKATAVEAFALKKEEDAAAEKTVSFKVYSTATTEFFGEASYVIKSATDESKHFTPDEAVYDAAKAAKKDDKEIAFVVKTVERDGKPYSVIVRLA